jgi:hypothetical protein
MVKVAVIETGFIGIPSLDDGLNAQLIAEGNRVNKNAATNEDCYIGS